MGSLVLIPRPPGDAPRGGVDRSRLWAGLKGPGEVVAVRVRGGRVVDVGGAGGVPGGGLGGDGGVAVDRPGGERHVNRRARQHALAGERQLALDLPRIDGVARVLVDRSDVQVGCLDRGACGGLAEADHVGDLHQLGPEGHDDVHLGAELHDRARGGALTENPASRDRGGVLARADVGDQLGAVDLVDRLALEISNDVRHDAGLGVRLRLRGGFGLWGWGRLGLRGRGRLRRRRGLRGGRGLRRRRRRRSRGRRGGGRRLGLWLGAFAGQQGAQTLLDLLGDRAGQAQDHPALDVLAALGEVGGHLGHHARQPLGWAARARPELGGHEQDRSTEALRQRTGDQAVGELLPGREQDRGRHPGDALDRLGQPHRRREAVPAVDPADISQPAIDLVEDPGGDGLVTAEHQCLLGLEPVEGPRDDTWQPPLLDQQRGHARSGDSDRAGAQGVREAVVVALAAAAGDDRAPIGGSQHGRYRGGGGEALRPPDALDVQAEPTQRRYDAVADRRVPTHDDDVLGAKPAQLRRDRRWQLVRWGQQDWCAQRTCQRTGSQRIRVADGRRQDHPLGSPREEGLRGRDGGPDAVGAADPLDRRRPLLDRCLQRRRRGQQDRREGQDEQDGGRVR